MILGNLLNRAFALIPRQPFKWCKWQGKTLTEQGTFIDEYAAPVELTGSIQAVEQAQYERLGLDFEKQYRRVYACADIKGLAEQETPDKLIFEGKNWAVVRTTPWHSADGWNCVFVVWDGTYEDGAYYENGK